jgi:hypothetical protein
MRNRRCSRRFETMENQRKKPKHASALMHLLAHEGRLTLEAQAKKGETKK